MIDVLLTHSYFMRFDRKQWRTMQPYAPLGTLYAASVLRNAGFSVALFDSMLANSENEIESYLKNFSPRITAIYDDSFNYLTKMCLSRMRIAAYKMLRIVKRYGITAIVFSPDSSDHAAEYLAHGADFVIRGEGESTLRELCTQILRGEEFVGPVPGLIRRVEDSMVEGPPRELIRQLDSLPFPAWDLVDIEKYRNAWKRHGYFSMNMVTTRGCPYGCNWCAKPVYGRVYNSRSPENVVDEILFLKQNYAPDHIWFCDDIFGLKQGWIEKFKDEILNAGIKIKYKCLSRPDLLLKENSFASLFVSGCRSVWIGAESGEQRILDAMEKGTTVDQIRLATRKLKAEGIKVGYFLQFGYPGENYEMVWKTVDLVREQMPDEIGISVSYPLPGTKFFETESKRIGRKTNWYDSDDLALLFPGAFRESFYRVLHRVVHRIHRIKRILTKMERLSLRSTVVLIFYLVTLPPYYVVLRLMGRPNPAGIKLHNE